MNDRLITVFGASGFLGRHAIRALARKGYRIRAVTRRPNLANHLPPMGHVGQIQLFKGDVHDEASVAEALRGAKAAINLVGVLFSRGEQSFEELHVNAAKTIAEECAKNGVRALTHVSALGADPNSESYYAKSKADGEARVREVFPQAAILRPSVIFGPEDSFLNRFAELARISPALPLIGGGHTKFQPIFAGDVAAAILTTLEDEHHTGKMFEIGGPTVYSFRALMEFILRETQRERVLISIPFPIAAVQAFFLQLMPNPLLTPDQVRLLRRNNIVSADAPGLAELGIVPTSIEAEAPAWLWRYRRHGQYDAEEINRATPVH